MDSDFLAIISQSHPSTVSFNSKLNWVIEIMTSLSLRPDGWKKYRPILSDVKLEHLLKYISLNYFRLSVRIWSKIYNLLIFHDRMNKTVPNDVEYKPISHYLLVIICFHIFTNLFNRLSTTNCLSAFV